MRKFTHFRPRIRSRHPSHGPLRKEGAIVRLPFRSMVRFGSSTPTEKGIEVELNTVKAIANSSNKILMKKCFTEAKVRTALWYQAINNQFFTNIQTNEKVALADLQFPIIAKHKFGSRGRGNSKHDTIESLRAWLGGKRLENYIFEKYYNFVREYRLHVSEDGCFYTCRKMLKSDTPDQDKWFRNDRNCVWILEENEAFDKPANWQEIINQSVEALKSTGLDFGAIDLRVQGAKDANGSIRTNPDFIIVEINSAPSFGDVTILKYVEEIPKMLRRKHQKQ